MDQPSPAVDQPSAAVDTRQLTPLCSLGDPNRRRLYEYVVARAEPVTRDRASEDLAIERSTVAYHLDKLVDEGLLTTSFARLHGRAGPGAGRPAKHYERSRHEFAVSVPGRDYQLAAELLARAAEADGSGAVRDALDRAAVELGRELAAGGAQTLLEHLAAQGYEPYHDGEVVRLRNCPFHRLAREHTELVCGMNRAMLAGIVEATNAPYEARLDPAEERCCVAFVPTVPPRG